MYISCNYSRTLHVFVSLSKQVAIGLSNGENGLKVKQLAKETPTLRTLMQKNLVEFLVNDLTFSILSSLKLNFSTTVSGTS